MGVNLFVDVFVCMKTLSFHMTCYCLFFCLLFVTLRQRRKKKKGMKLLFSERQCAIVISVHAVVHERRQKKTWQCGPKKQMANQRAVSLIDWSLAAWLIETNSSYQFCTKKVGKCGESLAASAPATKQPPSLDSCHIQTWASLWLFTSVFIRAQGLFDVFITFLFTQLRSLISLENNPFTIDWHEGNKSCS